jgi:hypothetical protein
MIDRNNISPDEGLSLDEIVSPREIVGIEFYQAANVPMEFVTRKNSGCGLLVIWSREQLKEPKKGR